MSGHSDHDRVSALFLAACELAPDERGPFLDRACADDAALRADVESLLGHDGSGPSILEFGAAAAAAFASLDRPPRQIGPYRVLEQLGEGGMGVVYRAEQEAPIRRIVAVKLIRPGLATREVLARFAGERQALALMAHPNVARVIDAGSTEEGRPYFAMEFVDGEPIADYCDRHRISIDERLALFRQICDGVQHAHHKAVIHRDLKPSNVLVAIEDGRPVPKIIDFGVAKALAPGFCADGPATRRGELVGTLEYMSPEQAGRAGDDVDSRTDVYALGVLLYELLAGAHPFRDDATPSADELRRRIRDDDPPLPSVRFAALPEAVEVAERRQTDAAALARRLRGDLDAIVLRAMERDPARRYPSPSELAADLLRHLEHEPVVATRAGRLYRLRKFSRKHRVGVGFAATLALVLVVFAGAMAAQAVRLAHERDRVSRERARASTEAATTEQVLEFLVGLFEVAEPGELRGNTIMAREILDQSVPKIESELQDRPEVQARLLATMGRVYANLGLHAEARPQLERARARLAALAGPEHADTLRASATLGFLEFYAGRYDAAERLLVETLDAEQRVLGAEHPFTLTTKRHLANLYTEQKRWDEAERLQREVLETAVRALGAAHPQVLRSKNNLGILFTMTGRYDEAEPLIREALEAERRVLGDDHASTLSSMNSLAVVYVNQHRMAEARSLLLETLERKRRVLGPDHPSTLKTLYNLACLAARDGQPANALAWLEEAVERGYSRGAMAVDPDLAILAGHPEFELLLARVRQRAEGAP